MRRAGLGSLRPVGPSGVAVSRPTLIIVIGRLPLLDCNNHSLALSMPSGAVHPNIFQRPVFMGSGLAAARRPGMTAYFWGEGRAPADQTCSVAALPPQDPLARACPGHPRLPLERNLLVIPAKAGIQGDRYAAAPGPPLS